MRAGANHVSNTSNCHRYRGSPLLFSSATPLHILIVDDDDSLREAIGACLEVMGYEVGYASDGRSALDQVAQRRPIGEYSIACSAISDIIGVAPTLLERGAGRKRIRAASRRARPRRSGLSENAFVGMASMGGVPRNFGGRRRALRGL